MTGRLDHVQQAGNVSQRVDESHVVDARKRPAPSAAGARYEEIPRSRGDPEPALKADRALGRAALGPIQLEPADDLVARLAQHIPLGAPEEPRRRFGPADDGPV